MAEIFKPVPGYPDYEVGDQGTVVSLNYNHTGKRHALRDRRGDTYGHRTVALCRKGERPANKLVHQLVAEAFLGPCPDGLVVDHVDSDPTNNAVENLRYVTQKENSSTPHARAALSRANDKFKRPVVATAPDGSTAQFESVCEAGKQLGLKVCHVCGVLKGRRRMHHGYGFKYAEEA